VRYWYFQKNILQNTKAVRDLYVANLLFCGNKYGVSEGDLIFCSIDVKSCAVARFLVETTSEIWEENQNEQKFQ
jgi:hypothetical protein